MQEGGFGFLFFLCVLCSLSLSLSRDFEFGFLVSLMSDDDGDDGGLQLSIAKSETGFVGTGK